MSNNNNPLTDTIGGGDDSQNRFEKARIVTLREFNPEAADSHSYLTLEKFLNLVKPESRDQVKERILSGHTISEPELSGDAPSEQYSVYDNSYSIVEALKVGNEYFVCVTTD